MIYSCFNEKAGHYEYFSDDRGHPMNGDLPVPDLHGKFAGKVGVPAKDAGRPLPRDAKRTGTGWQARGMIVQCNNSSVRSLAGFGAEGSVNYTRVGFVAGGAVLGAWYEIQRKGTGPFENPIWGAVAGALVGSIIAYWAEGD